MEARLIEWDQGPNPIFHLTVSFNEERAEKTALSVRMPFPTRAERDIPVEKLGVLEGQKQTLSRLEQHLTMMQTRSDR